MRSLHYHHPDLPHLIFPRLNLPAPKPLQPRHHLQHEGEVLNLPLQARALSSALPERPANSRIFATSKSHDFATHPPRDPPDPSPSRARAPSTIASSSTSTSRGRHTRPAASSKPFRFEIAKSRNYKNFTSRSSRAPSCLPASPSLTLLPSCEIF